MYGDQMEVFKAIFMKIIRTFLFWIIISMVIIIYILFVLGFRITYSPNLETSWDAVGAIGQWIGALVGILIPITAVYIEHILEKSKKDIGESNIELLNEFKEFKDEYSEKIKALSNLVDNNENIVIDGGRFKESDMELKEKALKYINISMVTKTDKIAEHLGIGVEDTYNLLIEMTRHDETISSGGQLSKENMGNVIWTKKNKR